MPKTSLSVEFVIFVGANTGDQKNVEHMFGRDKGVLRVIEGPNTLDQ